MLNVRQVKKKPPPPQISPGGESVMGDDPPAQTAPLHRYIRQAGRAAPPQAPTAVAAAFSKYFHLYSNLGLLAAHLHFYLLPMKGKYF